jgi:hypothetical protein
MKIFKNNFLAILLVFLLTACSPAGFSLQKPTPFPTPDLTKQAVHAIRVDFKDMQNSREQLPALEKNLQQTRANLLSLSAGRAEWAYFKWAGHEDAWSTDVKSSNIDFLAEDAARFKPWAKINANIDVLSPLYIKNNPQKAALSFDGQPSSNLVGIMELVNGEYGQKTLDLIAYIAKNYPVDSITLSEMNYYVDGYGAEDKAAFLKYSGKNDWPRTADGKIDINDASIDEWRSFELNRFLEKASVICHQLDKQLYLDVPFRLADLENSQSTPVTRYALALQYADRIIALGYFDLDSFEPENLEKVARYLTQIDADKIILAIGLWNKDNQAVSADKLQRAISASQKGGLKHLWITPASLMDDSHYQVINQSWNPAPATP